MPGNGFLWQQNSLLFVVSTLAVVVALFFVLKNGQNDPLIVATKLVQDVRPIFPEWEHAVVATSSNTLFSPAGEPLFLEFSVFHGENTSGFIIVSSQAPLDIVQWSVEGKSNV